MSSDDARAKASSLRASRRLAPVLHFEQFRLDRINECLWHRERPLKLQPKVFALLQYLIERPGQLVTKAELLDALWGDAHVGAAVLKTHLNQVRRTLRDDARFPRFVETVHRRGYRFIAEVIEPCPEPELEPAGLPWHLAAWQQLNQAFCDSVSGERRSVLVKGELGIGKSSLLHRLLSVLGERSGVLLVHGICTERDGEPLAPVYEALGRACRAGAGRQLASAIRRSAPSWLEHVPEAFTGALELSARRPQRRRLLKEMTATVALLSRSEHVVVVLEDLHRADRWTLELVDELARSRGQAGRLLLIATQRLHHASAPGPAAAAARRLEANPRVQQIELAPLSVPDVSDYLELRFPMHDFPAELPGLLRDYTGGNALFLSQVVESWLDARSIALVEGRWRLLACLDAALFCVPPRTVAIAARELEGLGSIEVAALEAASLDEAGFCTRAVAAVAQLDHATLDELCRRWGAQGRFVRVDRVDVGPDGRTEIRGSFHHPLLRRAIYERLDSARREALHLRMAQWAESDNGEDANAASLARQFERGGDYPRAVRYRKLAWERARARSAHAEAAEHSSGALALVGRIPPTGAGHEAAFELLLSFASPLGMASAHAPAETERLYRRAFAICESGAQTPAALAAVASVACACLAAGRYARAEHLGRELLALSQLHEQQAAERDACFVLGVAKLYLGELSQSHQLLERARALGASRARDEAPSGVRDAAVGVHGYRSLLAWHAGDPDAALSELGHATAWAQHSGDRVSVAFSLSFALMLHQLLCDGSAVRKAAGELMQLADQTGLEAHRGCVQIALGVAALEAGAVEPGLALVREGWRVRRGAGVHTDSGYWSAITTIAWLKAGHLGQAIDAIAAGLRLTRRLSERLWQPELMRLHTELTAVADAPLDGMGFTTSVDPDAPLGPASVPREMAARALER